MKINERWPIEGGRGDFILVEHKPGKNPKTGEATVSQFRSYHPTLRQCADKIAKTHALDAVNEADLERAIYSMDMAGKAVFSLLQLLEKDYFKEQQP